MTITCPICQVAMNPTANPNMFICNRRKVFVKELDCTLETTHAMIYLNPEGKQSFKVIEVLPFTFEIHDSNELKKTRISKLSKLGNKDKTNPVTRGNRTFESQTLIELPGVVHCDWHNKQSVYDRVKMYMVFS